MKISLTNVARARTLDGLGFVLLLALLVFSVSGFEQDWDTVAYHLPYAALRSGLLKGDQLVLSSGLQARYDGFPAFIDLIQGWLWRLTGTAKAPALVAPLSIAVFALYARSALRLSLLWPVMIFLAVPILQTAVQAAYVDLWTNAFFSIHLCAAYLSMHLAGREAKRATIVSALALAVAVNSKEQFYLIGGASYGLCGALSLLRLWREPEMRAETRWQIAAMLTLAPVIFAAPLKNLIVYANPIYPIDMPPLGWRGPENAQFPSTSHLAQAPRILRYLLSQFDLNGLSGRARGYTIDQGESQLSPGYHMGGSGGYLLIATLALLALGLRRLKPTGMDVACLMAFAALVFLVGNFPGANELRYFSFVNITLLLATMTILRRLAASGDEYAHGLKTGFQILLVSSALFTGFVTDFVHLVPHPGNMAHAIGKHPLIRDELDEALKKSNTVCYSRFDPYGLFYAYIFNAEANHPYRLILDLDGKPCPEGSAEIM